MVSREVKNKVLATMTAIDKLVNMLTPDEKRFMNEVMAVASSKGNKAAEEMFK